MEKILYLEVNLVCIAILFCVFIRDSKLRNNDSFHIMFTRVLFSNMLFFLSDIAWGLLNLSDKPNIIGSWVTNIVYFSMSGISAFCWLDFVEKNIDDNKSHSKIGYLLKLIPPTLLVVLSVASFDTHWLFYIDASGVYQRGDLYLLQPVLAYMLPIYASIRAIIAIKKSHNSIKRSQYRSLAMFYVLPAIGGICQVVLMGTPMLNIGIALSALLVYFTFQDNMIMLDSLTSMNNRRSFDRYTEAVIHEHDIKSGKIFWMILMDVDYFKKINDGFGHSEGDRALITIADVLKNVCGDCDCFVARIGGDEFAACGASYDATYPEQLCEKIRRKLSETSRRYPFRIQLSMGYSAYEANMTAQQWFQQADKQLYAVKEARSA